MIKKLFSVVVVVVGFVLLVTPAEAARTVKNELPKASWTKYGVNPWTKDTDNDGYFDAWEVQNGFCPTNAMRGVRVGDAGCVKGKIDLKKEIYTPPAAVAATAPREIKTFASCAALTKTISDVATLQRGGSQIMPLGLPVAAATGLEASLAPTALSTAADYSSTNIQVAGVDEGDTVKTDGKYIYSLQNGALAIVSAQNPNSIKLLSETPLASLNSASELYVSGNTAVVVGTSWGYTYPVPANVKSLVYYPPRSVAAVAQLWNITDKVHPKLVRTVEVDGNLVTSRLTNGYLYVVLQNYLDYRVLNTVATQKTAKTNDGLVPLFRDSKGNSVKSVAYSQLADCNKIQYITPARDTGYTQVLAIPVNSAGSGTIGKAVVFGASGQVYMSQNNLYIASANYSWWQPANFRAPSNEYTEIFKFGVYKEKIYALGSQTVPGTVLNRFSMDEWAGTLRIATTIRASWDDPDHVKNNLYFLNEDLNRIGWYEGFGPGERIYSARFVGPRAYVVTFKETDPLFVFDVSDPHTAKELGRLSVPGYSNYLQPYDENHIIGIGKNAISNSSTPGFAWYQGIKVALFDITDPWNPKQMFEASIGDRGTDSPALRDPHAILFSKEKNLFAFPIVVAQLTEAQKAASTTNFSSYGVPTFRGLYVYNLDLVNGFHFIGGISHSAETGPYSYYGSDVNRSLYIGDTLFAVSPNQISAHTLSNLSQLSTVKINETLEQKNRDAKRLSDLKQLQVALELYYTDQNAYPAGADVILGSSSASCLNAAGWQPAGCANPYMGQIPRGAKGLDYRYTATKNKTMYTVTARLENRLNNLYGDIVLTPNGLANK